MFFDINICVLSNLKDNNEGEADCQNGPELLRQFIWCVGPGRLSVVLIPEERKKKLNSDLFGNIYKRFYLMLYF